MDKDVMKRPPRSPGGSMITLTLLAQILSTAFIIVAGTLYVFWKEVYRWSVRVGRGVKTGEKSWCEERCESGDGCECGWLTFLDQNPVSH